MSDFAAHTIAAPPQGFPRRLGRRVAMTFMAVVLVACVVAAMLSFSHALKERQAIRDQAMSAAVALSFGFDQEVAAGNALLKGLSSSPAVRSGDIKGFYDQLKATPIPDGSWLILQDLDGQVVNTLQPFGATLPRHRDFPTYPEALNRVRERGWTVSGRMASLVKPGTSIIALSLRINEDDGAMKGFITTVLSQARLGSILADHKVPVGSTTGLYDRKLQPIVTRRGIEISSHIPAPGAFRTVLASRDPAATLDGFAEAVDERGIPVMIAYRRSGATDWTTTVAVPMAVIDAPIAGVLWQIAGPAALLLLAGGLAALFTARQVERPLRTLSHLVTKTESEVTELSTQLLALQEEERQRIARELHDSTAQRLVAASLGLGRLEAEHRQSPTGRKACGEIGDQLDKALLELRVFTYLLHPPNLADDGLRATLEEFIEGFARRTGLRSSIRISDQVDASSPDIQRAILRVVQEALANVHRHAGASKVHVGAKLVAGCLVVRIRDDGRGMKTVDVSAGRQKMGVGIPGMHARLQQFGGNLKIRTGTRGTSLLAYVPLSEPSEVAVNPLSRRAVPDLRARWLAQRTL
jgi:two-component system, NarL family, sensor kinase